MEIKVLQLYTNNHPTRLPGYLNSPETLQYVQILLYNVVKVYVLSLYGGRCQYGL
jgi:hypothetical protein